MSPQGSDHAAAQQCQEQSEKQSEIIKDKTKLRLPRTIEEELATLAAVKPRFKEIISQLNFDNIPAFASRLRQSLDSRQQARLVEWVRCRIGKAAHGSYNLVFSIEFEDKVQWCLKIPANGNRRCFDIMAAEALQSEALTMRKIRLETTIPLPAMYAFDSTIGNELGCPYIVMEWLQGKSLWEMWFDKSTTPARLEQVRLRALQTIAAAMVQLNRYQTNFSGAWHFNAGLEACAISGAKVIDMWAVLRDANQEQMDDIWVEKPPRPDPMDTLLFMLNRRGVNPQSSPLSRGKDVALKLFTKWGEERASSLGPKFVLTHPDLDIQNMLVDEDGTLCGIVDWDGVAFVPHSVGCLKYPMFLTREWCPAEYNYCTKDGGKKWINRPIENSPDELRRYRAIYAQFVEAAFSTNLLNKKTIRAYGDVTRRSALTASLAMADQYPLWIDSIVENVFLGISKFTAEANFDIWLARYLVDGIVSISVNGKDRLATETETVKIGVDTVRIEERCDARGIKRSHHEVDSGEDACDNQTRDHNADGTFKTGAGHHDQVEVTSIDVQGKRCIAEEARLSLNAQTDTIVRIPQTGQSLGPPGNSNSVSIHETAVKAPDLAGTVNFAEYSGGAAKKARKNSAEAVHKISIPGFKAEITRAPKESLPGELMVQTTEDAAPGHLQTSTAVKDPSGSGPHKHYYRNSAETKPSAARSDVEASYNGAAEAEDIADQEGTDLRTRGEIKNVPSKTDNSVNCPRGKTKASSAPCEEDLCPAVPIPSQIWDAMDTKIEHVGISAAAKGESRHGEDVPYRGIIDKGRFEMDDIYVALANNTLDQARYSRLKCGFEFFLDHLLGKF